MHRVRVLIVLLLALTSFNYKPTQYIDRQGQVSFFSYTTAEHIAANNNQVLSIIDISKNEIAISMLMKAFVFKKSLMRTHFNESYLESDLYPKATFKGQIVDFDTSIIGHQTRMVKGTLTIKDVAKAFEIKTDIQNTNGKYLITGDFEIAVSDFNIKIPSIVAPNIAKVITTKFRFEYKPHEE